MESSRGPPRVKNKAAAAVQISAEQLLREAVDRREVKQKEPTVRFADLEELHEFQGRKRSEFEKYIRINRLQVNNWLRYAEFELSNKEFKRARSIVSSKFTPLFLPLQLLTTHSLNVHLKSM